MHTETEITVSPRTIECDVTATGWITTGGSNSHGSDDPAWVEVEDVTLAHTDGRAMSKRLADLIWMNHSDTIEAALIDSAE